MMQTSSASLYGKGIFTTTAIHNGKVLLWEKHRRRLTDNAAKIGIDLAEHTDQSIRNALEEAIAVSGLREGRARVTFYDESPSTIWSDDVEKETTLSIIVAERRVIPQPFKLTISPYRVNSRSPLAGVKSCNYLENILALDEAKSRGFHEAVRVNERGHITSASMANIFWLKDGRLFTPSLTTGCLAGTTREFVLENIDCEEVETAIDVLNDAAAVFLTSAGLGVVQVSEFDARALSKVTHPITELLFSSVPMHREWLVDG
jgi:branched-chain amino acid aminotransferase